MLSMVLFGIWFGLLLDKDTWPAGLVVLAVLALI